ncbi:MAG: lamin tail domain-containing protein [Pirellulaceae bacterium]|nr:lamin tail domain-containing protein [Pirellulaceae bacterium]
MKFFSRKFVSTFRTRPRRSQARTHRPNRSFIEYLEPRHLLDSTVVFNEVMYHPPNETSGQEWIELFNQLAVDVDLSGWKLAEGVNFTFPSGTRIPGGGYLVIAAEPNKFQQPDGPDNVLGPFNGKLSNGGETIELRNNSNRTMDRLEYDDQYPWPVVPDGSGVTLAKQFPMTGSAQPINWIGSSQLFGTPGKKNFLEFDPSTIRTTPIPLGSTWRFDDRGTEFGSEWRQSNFDDSQWSIDQAAFVAGRDVIDNAQPAAITTLFSTGMNDLGKPLDPGEPDDHWRNNENGEALLTMLGHPAWISNNAESNWIGLVGQGTQSVASGSYSFRHEFDLSKWDASTASITIQVAADDRLDDVLLNGKSLDIKASGFTRFQGPFTVNHGFLKNLNNLEFMFTNGGVDPNPSGLRVQLEGTAFPLATNSRLQDHTNSYYFRQTFDYDSTPNTELALELSALVDDGAVFYLNGQEVYRHNMPDGEIDFATRATREIANAMPVGPFEIMAENLQLGTNVLAVEVHRANGDQDDIQFDAKLTILETPILTTPPQIRINEMAAATDPEFWVELINLGDHEVNLEGFVIQSSADNSKHTLSAHELAAGQFLKIEATDLGFQPSVGDHLFLYNFGETSVIDGQVVANQLKGRSAQHAGRWMNPSKATPGATNQFAFHDEIVINEIQYHARPTVEKPATPATFSRKRLVSFDATWLYDESGRDLGANWFTTTFEEDNINWFSGPAPLGFGRGTTGKLIKTQLNDPKSNDPRVATFYFQTQFDFTGDLSRPELQLELSHLIDDGAAFYLNGIEIKRHHLPEGPLDYQVLADTNVGQVETIGPVIIPTDALQIGQNVLSVELHQRTLSSFDMVLGAQLSIAEPLTDVIPGEPYVESNEEWIELYNRSDQMVDLTGWNLNEAVRFEFEPGTIIRPSDYLVVAKDVNAFRQSHPQLTHVTGGYEGSLGNSSDLIVLLDNQQNVADEVPYFDGGYWSSMADGNGSTLELRDPHAENARAQSWTASDESDKSDWQEITYQGSTRDFPETNDPHIWNELIFGLLEAGEIMIDDISVIEDPDGHARQMMQNGTFDNGLEHYRLVGNHGAHGLSRVVADPDDPDNPVLHLVATGATEHMSNHVETTFVDNTTIQPGLDYEISYRARWLAGSSQVNTRLYFNKLARTSVLDVPKANGTPGAQNSKIVSNQGPTYSDLKHTPLIPSKTDEVTVSLRAADPDTVASMSLWYAADGGKWHRVAMSAKDGGEYAAVIPPHSSATVVQFYAEGTDGRDARSTFPPQGPESRSMFVVNDGRDRSTSQHSFRLVMTAADVALQNKNTNLLSNHRLGATIITDGKAYYDVAVRLKGSGFGRTGSTRGYNIQFHPDQLFRGVHETIAIDRKDNQFGAGASHREIVLKHIATAAGGIHGMYDDLIYVIPPDNSFTGPAQLQMARYDSEFLDASFANGSDGTRFELELIYHTNRTVDGSVEGLKLTPNAVLGVDIEDMGPNKEAYRWNLLIKNHRQRDDYSQIIELGKTFDLPNGGNGSEIDIKSQQTMDVDQWLRNFAYSSLGGVNDTYHQGLPHNLMLFVRPEDQRVVAMPWDQDLTFHHSPRLNPLGSGSNFAKIIRIPNNRHHYFGHLHDIMSTTYNVDYLGPWIEHYSEFVRLDATVEIRDYIEKRRAFVLDRLPDSVDFAIDTVGPITTDDAFVTLTGSGWIDVRDIRVRGAEEPLNVVWHDNTIWKLTLPVPAGPTDLILEATNLRGELVGASTINVTSTVTDRPLEQYLRVTEIMYNPADPTTSELTNGHNNNDDFEYLELLNTGPDTIQLTDARLVTVDGMGVDFDFATSAVTELAPGESVLVVEDSLAFRTRYGDDLPVAGQWNGQLSNAGEAITLRAGLQTIQQFAFEDAWYPASDGGGQSLVIIDPDADLAMWNQPDAWSPSGIPGGSPGVATGRPGDANSDGSFDSNDLIAILQAGEFEDDIAGNSTFAEGDWNGDGDFTTSDLVLAFTIGGYVDQALAAVKILPTSTVAAIDQLYFVSERSPLQSSDQWKESGKTDVTIETDRASKKITLDLQSLERVFDESDDRKQRPTPSQRP